MEGIRELVVFWGIGFLAGLIVGITLMKKRTDATQPEPLGIGADYRGDV